MKKIYDVYGVGDIILDIIVETTNEELQRLNIQKGVQEIINLEKRDHILNNLNGNTQNLRISGHNLNVFKALSCLGLKINLATKLGMDEFGFISQKELSQTRINFDFRTGFGCTDSCMTFILPDSSVTKHKHQGISKNISYKDIDVIKLKQSKNLLIDTNLIDTNNRMRVARYLSRIAHESDCKIIFEINNTDNMLKNKEITKELLEISDVIISSFENAFLLFGENDKKKLLELMGSNSSVRILKTKNEYLSCFDGKSISISRIPQISKAGNEYFIAGFIFGYNQDYGVEKSCILGSYLSGKEFIDDNILDDLHRVF